MQGRYTREVVTTVEDNYVVRPFEPSDSEAVLALNAACQPEVGSLDEEKLSRFAQWAPYLRVVESTEGVAAFLIGLTEGAPYESPNYRWFCERFDSFAYVDRIAVAEQARGAGVGPMFYQDFERWAESNGRPSICAEVNVEPPNPRSIRFHEIFGFTPVEEFEPTGSADYRVVMLAKEIGSQD